MTIEVVYVITSGRDEHWNIDFQGARLTIESARRFANEVMIHINKVTTTDGWTARKDSINYTAMWIDNNNERWVRIDEVQVAE